MGIGAMLRVMPAFVLQWARTFFSLAAADAAEPDIADVTPVQSLRTVIIVIVVVLVSAALAALVALIYRYRKSGEKPSAEWPPHTRKR